MLAGKKMFRLEATDTTPPPPPHQENLSVRIWRHNEWQRPSFSSSARNEANPSWPRPSNEVSKSRCMDYDRIILASSFECRYDLSITHNYTHFTDQLVVCCIIVVSYTRLQLKSLFPKRVKSTFGTSEKNRFLWQNLYTCLWENKI